MRTNSAPLSAEAPPKEEISIKLFRRSPLFLKRATWRSTLSVKSSSIAAALRRSSTLLCLRGGVIYYKIYSSRARKSTLATRPRLSSRSLTVLIAHCSVAIMPTCALCGEPAPSLCSGCRFVSYCGAECQRKDWPEHKILCKAIKEDMKGDCGGRSYHCHSCAATLAEDQHASCTHCRFAMYCGAECQREHWREH